MKALRIITCLLIAITTAVNAHAWPGFEWETWRQITNAAPPNIESEQAGYAELLPLLKTSFDAGKTIDRAAEWEVKRTEIINVLSAILGAPTDIAKPEPSADIGKREDMGDYTRTHLRIASEADDEIPAYFLKPKDAEPGPVMIVLHQTQAPGKREACGMTGNPEMQFALELVNRGITCIVPDAIGFGERIPVGGQPYDGAHAFYEKHPQWSFFGKMNWDLSRMIDYLETRDDVDASRIGVIGHSHGAYGSIMGTVFEPRIRLAVASCGFNTLRTDPDPNRWSHLTALMPRIGFYVDDIQNAPIDWHEIIACIAPRPYFNWATLEDEVFPNTENLSGIYEQVEAVYALYDAEDRFEGWLAPGKHRFPKEAREEAYDWIEKQFAAMRD